jgi:hypothetical protein
VTANKNGVRIIPVSTAHPAQADTLDSPAVASTSLDNIRDQLLHCSGSCIMWDNRPNLKVRDELSLTVSHLCSRSELSHHVFTSAPNYLILPTRVLGQRQMADERAAQAHDRSNFMHTVHRTTWGHPYMVIPGDREGAQVCRSRVAISTFLACMRPLPSHSTSHQVQEIQEERPKLIQRGASSTLLRASIFGPGLASSAFYHGSGRHHMPSLLVLLF